MQKIHSGFQSKKETLRIICNYTGNRLFAYLPLKKMDRNLKKKTLEIIRN